MRRKGGGCLSWIVGIGALVLFVFALDVIGDRIDRARFPWGYETPGKSTLAGNASLLAWQPLHRPSRRTTKNWGSLCSLWQVAQRSPPTAACTDSLT